MKRCKWLEYPWIFKDSFVTTGYTFTDSQGNQYVIWAKNMTDAKWLISCKKISIVNGQPSEYVSELKPFVTDKLDPIHGYKVAKRPFWYYGRVYKVK